MFLLIIRSIIYHDDEINNKDIKINIFFNLFIVHRRKENLSLRNKKEGNLSYKWRK